MDGPNAYQGHTRSRSVISVREGFGESTTRAMLRDSNAEENFKRWDWFGVGISAEHVPFLCNCDS
jgi:hypothetical protein